MALFFREFDRLTMDSSLADVSTYEEAVKAYIAFAPIKLLAQRVKGIKDTAREDNWDTARAVSTYKELNIDEVDPDLPKEVRETVIKLHLIQRVVAKRIVWAESLYLHTLAQKVGNYLLKIKLTEYGDWNEDLWGAALVTDATDLSELDIRWASLLCSADDKEIEQHAKVLVDKLEIAKTTKFRKPFKDAKAHSMRCEKLNISIYDYSEDYVLERYEFIFDGVKS